jgi:hypothetical protein
MSRRALRLLVTASLAISVLLSGLPAGASPQGARPAERRWEDNKWRTPGNNIWCFSPSWGVKCGTRNDGFTVALRRSGPGIRLADGNVFTFPEPIYTLGVGHSWSWDEAGIVCRTLVVGIRCRSTRNGHGFFLSRDRYDLY